MNEREEALKPEYAAMTPQQVADAVNSQTVPAEPVCVFLSFRSLGALLTCAEYDTLRWILDSACEQEKATNGHRLQDIRDMLKQPGDQAGNGGGIDFNLAETMLNLEHLCSQSELVSAVPAKIASYVASMQPAPTKKFREIHAGDVAYWRNQ